jgi:hypothetical protein
LPPPPGFNVANRAWGGRVESWTSQYNDGERAAANLVDGTARGWSSKDRTTPQEVVLSFHQGLEAQVAAVVVDTRTEETLADPATKRDMERVARLTGGMFFDATDAAALTRAMQQSLAVPYDVLDAAGTRVGCGLTGQEPIKVPEGIFAVIVLAAGQPITVPRVRVAPNGSAKVVLKKEGREVGVQVLGP